MKRNQFGLAAVAEHAGVSVATVSNVLNRPGIVSTRTRALVRASMDALDFVPNRAAATLRQGTSHVMGLVVPDITNPFYAEIARGVTDAADAAGYAVVLCVSNDDPDREARQLTMLAEMRATGALMVPITAEQTRLRRLRAVGSRLVLIDRRAASNEGCAVAVDDVQGARTAVEHLLASGRTRVALVNGSREIAQCENRHTGTVLALAGAGRDVGELTEHTVQDMSLEEGRDLGHQLAQEWVDSGGAGVADGVFCINDLLALGVVIGLQERGVRVPDDVAVVGYGDLEVATHGVIGLTTVEQPKYEIGRAAVRMLLDEATEDPAAHRHSTMLYTPGLVVRESAPSS